MSAQPLTRQQSWMALGLLIGFAAANQVVWSLADEGPSPHGDTYVYLKNLLRFLDELGSRDLTASIRRLSVLGRPPLYQLMTTPFILLFGRSEAAAVSVNIVFLALLAIATFNLGRLVRNEKVGLLAAFLVLTYPPIVHLSRMYLPHFASCAWAALSLWLLFEVVDRRSIAVAWLWGLSLAVGLLNHPYFAWALLGPAIATGLYLVFLQSDSEGSRRSQGSHHKLLARLGTVCRDRFVRLGLLPAALIALGPSLLWYLTLGLPGLRQLRSLSERDVFVGSFHGIETQLGWYALSTPFVMSNVLAAALVVGLIVAIVRARLKTTILLIALGTGYMFYSALPIRAWWYISCLLPAAAVLSTMWIVDVRRKWQYGAVLAAMLLVGFCNYFLVTWGEAHAWVEPVARALGSPLSDQKTCRDKRALALCPGQVRPQPWPWEKIAALMLADADCETKRPCQLLLADLPGSGRAMMDYVMAREGHGGRIVAHKLNGNQPYAFDALLLSDFIACPDGPRSSGQLVATTDFLRNPPLEFSNAHREVATIMFPAPYNRPARLLKRVKPLSFEEVEASSKAFDLPAEHKFQISAAFSGAFAMAGDTEKALELYATIQDGRARMTTRIFLIKELMALAHQHDTGGSRERANATYEAVLQLRP